MTSFEDTITNESFHKQFAAVFFSDEISQKFVLRNINGIPEKGKIKLIPKWSDKKRFLFYEIIEKCQKVLFLVRI